MRWPADERFRYEPKWLVIGWDLSVLLFILSLAYLAASLIVGLAF